MKTILSLLGFSLLANVSQGAVIYSGQQNIPIPYTFDGIYVNLITLATATIEPTDFDSTAWLNVDFGGVDISNGDLVNPVVLSGSVVENLVSLTLVDSSRSFTAGANGSSTHMGAGPAQFQAGAPGYIGFSLKASIGGPTHYGWAQVVLKDDGSPGTIVDWAYDDTPSAAIAVGVIPEPASVSLLAVCGAFALRRKRR